MSGFRSDLCARCARDLAKRVQSRYLTAEVQMFMALEFFSLSGVGMPE
jgi:hypothetical protein